MFIKWARKRKPTIIVCEATGGYQNDFVRQLIKANLPIHTANPARIKHYIASLGTKAKTDKSDARYIAMYALERQPESMKDRGETHRKLKECLATRRQFVDEVKRLKCQFKHLTDKKLKSAMMRVLKHLKQEIDKITVVTLLVDCPELGEISAVKASALIALAHKILRITSALLKKKQMWNPNLSGTPT